MLIEQRKKGQQLESELSSAQDRIRGAERRAHWLEEENTKIKGELQQWNDYYNQEETSPEVPVSVPISNVPSAPDGASLFNFSTPQYGLPASQVMSGPSLVTSAPAVSSSMPLPGWYNLNLENIRQRQDSGHRVSFGSVFPESSGNGAGNGNGGEERCDSIGGPQSQNVLGSNGTTFNIRIKPKDPPFFHGRSNEDVDTWISKVGDFLYLTEANSRQ